MSALTQTQSLPGFIPVAWKNVLQDEEVYLAGTSQGEPCAYGPHVVMSKNDRLLRNARRRIFRHYPEDLLRRID